MHPTTVEPSTREKDFSVRLQSGFLGELQMEMFFTSEVVGLAPKGEGGVGSVSVVSAYRWGMRAA